MCGEETQNETSLHGHSPGGDMRKKVPFYSAIVITIRNFDSFAIQQNVLSSALYSIAQSTQQDKNAGWIQKINKKIKNEKRNVWLCCVCCVLCAFFCFLLCCAVLCCVLCAVCCVLCGRSSQSSDLPSGTKNKILKTVAIFIFSSKNKVFPPKKYLLLRL